MPKITMTEFAELWGRISKLPMPTKVKILTLLQAEVENGHKQLPVQAAEGK